MDGILAQNLVHAREALPWEVRKKAKEINLNFDEIQ